MKAALQSIDVTKEHWLPVRKMFGQPFVLKTASLDEKRRRLRTDMVNKFLADMPSKHTRNKSSLWAKRTASTFNITLQEEPDETDQGALPKFYISGADPDRTDGLIVDADIGKKTHILQCRFAHVCHGILSPGDDPATLLVILFVFQPRGRTKRFKQVEVTLRFLSHGQGDAPQVVRASPDGEYALFPSEKEVEISHVFSPSLEGTVGLAKGTVGYEMAYRSTKQVKNWGSVYGVRRPKEVFWGLYENPDSDSGIPSMFQGAVLLTRGKYESDPYGQKFNLEVDISGNVNRKSEGQEKMKNMWGQDRKGEAVLFDPKTSSKGTNIVKDVTRLGDEDVESFKRIVAIRDWKDGAGQEGPIRVEQGLAQVEVEQQQQPAETRGVVATQLVESAGFVHASVFNIVEPGSQGAAAGDPALTATDDQPARGNNDMAVESNQVSGQLGLSVGPRTVSQKFHHLPQQAALDIDQRLGELHGELARVRIEANLVRRLLMLEKEEARILREITELEMQKL
ncbi:hypothetical protein QBC34DRAFT_489906 [Podospora aff. communis PSN243]|uniref:Oxysterol-binding protein n=1 Tax=Podospora aff. communis PSN243 TaxID=3040156 RepID=A0AAV9H9D3_9PEZI|nr:hypothetical protein QBC34DRAFT_489906 [Podospora aff. communis PSN243]